MGKESQKKKTGKKGIGQKFDLDEILEECGLDRRYVDNSPNITEDELKEIFIDYVSAEALNDLYEDEFKKIVTNVKGIHSVKGRIKDPKHLIGKIIRNAAERPDKYSDINSGNYYKLITDLVGFRIIVLNKKDWYAVHKALSKLYKNDPELYIDSRYAADYIEKYDKIVDQSPHYAEQPKVYLTEADIDDDTELYNQENIEVDSSRNNYRSLHYIIRKDKFYFEIQVRSFFEEGWLEFEHKVCYPNDQGNKAKQQYVRIMSDMARAADGLISFYDSYEDIISDNTRENFVTEAKHIKEKEEKSGDYVDNLKLS